MSTQEETQKGDSAVLSVAEDHPIVVQHTIIDQTRFNTVRVYNSYSFAADRFARMRNREHSPLHCIGRAIVDDSRTGRPVDVYFNGDWTPKCDNLRHEKKLTDFCLCYPEATYLRGPHTGDELFDAIMKWDDKTLAIEMDCGTMPKKKVQARWEKVKHWKGPIAIVVAPRYGTAMDRIKQLIGWGEEINDFAFYVDLSKVIEKPLKHIWLDCQTGEKNKGFTIEELWNNCE